MTTNLSIIRGLDWEKLFDATRLGRGYDYYLYNLVYNFKVENNHIHATVNGYKVAIEFEDDIIDDMNCNCPYAMQGNTCKHMAALLYYAEKLDDKDFKPEDIIKLVDQAEIEEVKQFLVEVLKNDDLLLNRFKQILNLKVTDVDLSRYKKLIDNIFDKYSDKYGYINYSNGRGLCNEIADFCDVDIQRLVDDEEYNSAFQLTNYVFERTSNQAIDGSNGEVGEIMHYCTNLWEAIFNTCDIDFEHEMFDWFIQHLDGSIIDYMEESIESFLFNNFFEPEFLEQKAEFIKDKLSNLDIKSDNWSTNYNANNWALRYIQLLEETDTEDSIIEKVCKQYWSLDKVRKFYIANLTKKEDYLGAIKALEESKVFDKRYPGLMKQYSYQLKDIYKKLEMQSEYTNELRLLLTDYDEGNLELFKEYKKLFSDDEWLIQREKLFNDFSSRVNMAEIYILEGLYEELLHLVINSSNIHQIHRYSNVLIDKYPKEILDKYCLEVEQLAIPTTGRSQYKNLVKILRDIKQLNGGQEAVQKIVNNWRIKYAKRKAMMEELNRL